MIRANISVAPRPEGGGDFAPALGGRVGGEAGRR